MAERVFFTAQWRNLAMLNFEFDPDLLAPFVPRGLELDLFRGRAYASIVGFAFLDAKVFGLALPGHRAFPELNLRTYVRRELADETRRGVVFLKEIVNRRLVAWAARKFYYENYLALPMDHSPLREDPWPARSEVSYAWRTGTRSNQVAIEPAGPPQLPEPGSLEEFIVEHYWGYSRTPAGSALEYRVEHPPWRIALADRFTWNCDAAAIYGAELASCLTTPASAFLADGSPVRVYCGTPCGETARRRFGSVEMSAG
jgi:uncharacterized protein YqjF (DUF2071 family)